MTLVHNELDVLAELVPLHRGLNVVELGCGSARLATDLLTRFEHCRVTGLEVDQRQHAKNLARLPAALQGRLHFVQAGAQAVPAADGSFQLALMLKSLHHVPLPLMQTALAEVARVLQPGGWLYVSEPVYHGALNDIVKLFNDEGTVRAAAQGAVDEALQAGCWTQVAERRFDMPVHFADWAEFEQRMLYPTFADHGITDTLSQQVRAVFEPHGGPQGAHFTRPMHVRLLQKNAV